jgi:hypothetical protein
MIPKYSKKFHRNVIFFRKVRFTCIITLRFFKVSFLETENLVNHSTLTIGEFNIRDYNIGYESFEPSFDL